MRSELLSRLQDPFLQISLGVRITIFLGIVLLMAAKPELLESIGIVGGSAVLGLLLSLVVWRRSRAFAATNADLGN